MSTSSKAFGEANWARPAIRQHSIWRLEIAFAFGIVGAIAGTGSPTLAQLTPDATLDAEGSVVTPNANVGGFPAQLIQGGATRGANLFHSFSEFNVGAGQRVYFTNPAGIETILTRVTGNTLSNISGTLGVTGRADLFLLNPNGIIFGPNARLDVGGSFVGTTANAIQFGDQGFWSATNPAAPSLLSVNPSALWFTQIRGGTIVNNSRTPAGTSPIGIELFGLRVPDGQSLLLVGGDIQMDRGSLNAPGGRIELGGLAEAGAIELERTGNMFRLGFPSQIRRSNITLANDARVSVRGSGGGDIVVNANLLSATNGGRLVAGTEGAGNGGDITVNATQVNLAGVGQNRSRSGFHNQKIGNGTARSNAGNVTVNTESFNASSSAAIFNDVLSGVGNGGNIIINTNSLLFTEAELSASAFGQGDAANIIINARDRVSFNDGRVYSTLKPGAVGSSGDIVINAGSLSLTNGAQLITVTEGQGDAGNVQITARDTVSLDGVDSNGFFSGIFSRVSFGAVGSAGDITINSGTLFLTKRTQLNTSSFGQGNAGNVSISARDTVSLERGYIFSSLGFGAVGKGGNITIDTGSLFVTDNAVLSTISAGRGDAGNIRIIARDTVSFARRGDAESNLEATGVGRGGDIAITARVLSVTDKARISTTTRGQGDAGDIRITADETISVTNGARLSAGTVGQGDAGDVMITARDSVSFDGSSSGAFSTVEAGATGNGGNVNVMTGSLFVSNGPQLVASTFGRGDAGSVNILAHDTVFFDGVGSNGFASGAFSTVEARAMGNGGDVNVTTGSLSVTNGAQLVASTFGRGGAGSVNILAHDAVLFDGVGSNGFASGAFSTVEARAMGNGGDVNVTTGSLFLTNGAQLNASTFGQGDAGNISVRTTDSVTLTNNSIVSSAVLFRAVGKGGDINIQAGSLSLTDSALLYARADGQGNAGNIFVVANDSVSLANSSRITSSVGPGGVGNGGDVNIQTRSLSATNGSQVQAAVFREYGNLPGGRGRGGNIRVNASDSINLSGVSQDGFSSGLLTLTERGASGKAGDITVNTAAFRIADGAAVSAQTFNLSDGGNITINTDTLEAVNGGQVLTTTRNRGRAGNITINATDSIIFSGSDPNFTDRLARFSGDEVISEGAASGVFASTRSNSTGNGGTITLQTNTLSLRDRAQISASSEGTGRAGDVGIVADGGITLTNSGITTSAEQASGGSITITADSLSLNRGRITAATGTNGAQDAANITLQGLDLLLMGNESLISANALNQANGGNITIDSRFIVATPPQGPEGSDITANAFRGNGGRVSVNTQGLFGIQFRPLRTPKNDITVTSEFGLAGVYQQSTPGVDPTRGLADLPTDVVDASRQIDRRCSPNSSARQSSFTVTGRGGLPPSPNDPLQHETVMTHWVTIDSEIENKTPPDTTTGRNSAPRQLVEAQGWAINEKGQVVLTAKAPSVTPNPSGLRELNCTGSFPKNAPQP
ncbi:MAG TPA: filamentous hemagglutinin N-terminal domain-containing protein [Waterburya sp.]